MRYLGSIFVILVLPVIARADMSGEIEAVLRDKVLSRAEESICVERLAGTPGQATRIYAHRSGEPMIPASNLKVITTSAALDRLGGDFKFRTQLVYHDGDLILIGDGDPTFGDAELLNKVGWNVTTVFQNWAAALKKINLPAVRNIVVDDSIFEQNFLHPRWPVDQVQKRYMAGIAGMNLNANCLDVFVRITSPGEVVHYYTDPATKYLSITNTCVTGNENAVWLSRAGGGNAVIMRGQARANSDVPVSVTVEDPPMYAATVMGETLAAGGIGHSGDVHRDRTLREQFRKAQASGDRKWVLLAVHETPIEQVIARANKDSMNLYAECLCKRLGAEVSGESGSWQNGPAAVAAFLHKVGVSDDQFTLDDGCGLSKQNSISAAAMVAVLKYDHYSDNAKTFIDSLAVAGVDGTLDDRFRGTDLRGRIFGKSGFVNGVSCLSGYLNAKDGNTYAFSILINGIPELSNSLVKVLEERIVRSVDTSVGAMASVDR